MASAVLLPLGAVGIVIAEGWANREAMTWAGLLLLLAVPFAVDAALRAGMLRRSPGGSIRSVEEYVGQ